MSITIGFSSAQLQSWLIANYLLSIMDMDLISRGGLFWCPFCNLLLLVLTGLLLVCLNERANSLRNSNISFCTCWNKNKQECIPVGCVPPACWSYPSMHCMAGCVSQHALGRGVSAWGVSAQGVFAWGYLPRGWLPWGGVCLWSGGGVSAGEGLPGGCLPLVHWGGVSQHAMGQAPPLWTDRHLWKHNLRKLRFRLRAVKIETS